MDIWIIIAISLAFSAFFSGIEIAFISANKLRIELESKQGILSSKVISTFFLSTPSRFIGAMLVGNNIALVVYGILMARVLEPFILRYVNTDVSLLVVQTIISTCIILVTAEFLPKTLFRINPNKVLTIFAFPVLIIYFLLYPLVFFVIGISEFVLKTIFRVEIDKSKTAFDRIDLDNYLKEISTHENHKEERDHEIQIFQNALDFSSIRVRDSMIPRPEIVALDVDSTIDELKETFIETGLSKILIYRETIDEIIGYVHSYELFKKPDTIREVFLPVLIIPETMPAQDAMKLFLQERKSIAVVVDEFGGTAGILTIEDIMEEIFGNIEDEHDTEELEEEKVSETEYVFSGRLEIDYLNEEYRLDLPVSDDYETLAGLLITHTGNIPKFKEEVRINDFRFIMEKVSDTRIEKVRLFLLN
ncbi:MAG: HlyC/CorC family transporter [Bacteroidetes bacterium]|nr:HlyC/CorC family transporter [Bacteroidota bacterium]